MQKFIRCVHILAGMGLSVGLAACGGYTSVDLGGSVTGLTTDGLVLANGSNTVAIPANATSYKFPEQIGDQDQYAVVVQTQPQRSTCTVTNGVGAASGIAITGVNVSCTPNTHFVGGTITGLGAATGLVLTNGSDTFTAAAGSTSFTFPTKVPEGSVYGVDVLTQPPGLTCSVANGTAVMGIADVANVQVNCQ